MKKMLASLCMIALAILSVPQAAPAAGEGLSEDWLPQLLNDGSPYDKDARAFRTESLKAAARNPTPLEGCWAVDKEELRVDGAAIRTFEAKGEAFYLSLGEPETTFPTAPCVFTSRPSGTKGTLEGRCFFGGRWTAEDDVAEMPEDPAARLAWIINVEAQWRIDGNKLLVRWMDDGEVTGEDIYTRNACVRRTK
ncbi:MAG: hypothetical protein J5828_02530 [Desulfovibrionaceae bacterium]|nr:hypothetical protein [Desulfovibrionaceae bacterium]